MEMSSIHLPDNVTSKGICKKHVRHWYHTYQFLRTLLFKKGVQSSLEKCRLSGTDVLKTQKQTNAHVAPPSARRAQLQVGAEGGTGSACRVTRPWAQRLLPGVGSQIPQGVPQMLSSRVVTVCNQICFMLWKGRCSYMSCLSVCSESLSI